MSELPPMMPAPNEPKPEKRPEEMTDAELNEKIEELIEDLGNAARSNQGSRELETILAEITNERARYEMERQRRKFQSGGGAN